MGSIGWRRRTGSTGDRVGHEVTWSGVGTWRSKWRRCEVLRWSEVAGRGRCRWGGSEAGFGFKTWKSDLEREVTGGGGDWS